MCKNKILNHFLTLLIKKLCRENPKTVIIDDTNNEKLDDDDAANLFAKFFCSKYSKDDGNEPVIPTINNFLNNDFTFNCDTMKTILKQLPNKFLSGPDAIPVFMLKRFSDELFTHGFNIPEIIKSKINCLMSGNILVLFWCTKVKEIMKYRLN